jgi:hypothetical protein
MVNSKFPSFQAMPGELFFSSIGNTAAIRSELLLVELAVCLGSISSGGEPNRPEIVVFLLL